MKYLFSLICFLGCFGALATVHTVDNGVNSLAGFTDLQVAIDQANAGDTILVKGSYVPYGLLNKNSSSGGSLTLDKQLVIIGEGAYGHPGGPSFENRLSKTFFGEMTLGENASGSKLYGLRFYGLIYGLLDGQSESVKDISISECSFESIRPGEDGDSLDGLAVVRSIASLRAALGQNIVNVKFTNNVFTIASAFGLVLGEGDNLFANNVVMVSGAYNSQVYDQDSEGVDLYEQEVPFENLKFENSVFLLATGFGRSEERLVFKSSNLELENCIVMGPATTRDLLETGNIEPVISNLSIERGSLVRLAVDRSGFFDPIRGRTPFGDYHLIEGSVGIANGTDGTNIGIYGGDTPWIDGPVWRYSNQPSIPVVESLQLEKKTVKPGEGLKVRVRARAKGNQ